MCRSVYLVPHSTRPISVHHDIFGIRFKGKGIAGKASTEINGTGQYIVGIASHFEESFEQFFYRFDRFEFESDNDSQDDCSASMSF